MSIPAPLEFPGESILPEWIDYNGHMNVSYYVLIFDRATDRLIDYLGLSAEFRAAHNASTFVAEMHVNYLREVTAGDEVFVATRLLDYDEKRFHHFHQMYHAGRGELVATAELLNLYMDMSIRRVSQMPPAILDRLSEVRQSHAALPVPEQVGSVMKVKR